MLSAYAGSSGGGTARKIFFLFIGMTSSSHLGGLGFYSTVLSVSTVVPSRRRELGASHDSVPVILRLVLHLPIS